MMMVLLLSSIASASVSHNLTSPANYYQPQSTSLQLNWTPRTTLNTTVTSYFFLSTAASTTPVLNQTITCTNMTNCNTSTKTLTQGVIYQWYVKSQEQNGASKVNWTSGKRWVEIRAATEEDYFHWQNDSGFEAMNLTKNTGNLLIPGTFGTGGGMSGNLVMNDYNITGANYIKAEDGTLNLENSVSANGTIKPTTNNTFDLGTTILLWANAYVNNLKAWNDVNTTDLVTINLWATNLESDLDGTGYTVTAQNFKALDSVNTTNLRATNLEADMDGTGYKITVADLVASNDVNTSKLNASTSVTTTNLIAPNLESNMDGTGYLITGGNIKSNDDSNATDFHGTNNYIPNVEVNLDATGFNITADKAIFGGVTVNGNTLLNGNLTVIGSTIEANVTQQTLNGSFYPAIDNIFNIGSSGARWFTGYFVNLLTTDINTTNLRATNLESNMDGTGYNITAAYFFGALDAGSLYDTTDLNNKLTLDCSNITGSSGALCNNQTADAIAALATTYYNSSSSSVVTGTPQGASTNINAYDIISYNISEASSDILYYVNFTGVTGLNQIVIRYLTIAGETHSVALEVWDYGSSTWEGYAALTTTGGIYNIKTIGVFDEDDHITGGIVQLRLSTTNAGGSTDKWQWDWITISNGPAIPSGTEIDPYSIHKDGTIPLTANWDAGAFNITADTFIGKFNYSSLQNIPSTCPANSAVTDLAYPATCTDGLYTLTEQVSNHGNWSADKASYSTKVQADLLYAGITEPVALTLGNWSADKASYATTAYANSLGNFSAWDKDAADLTNIVVLADTHTHAAENITAGSFGTGNYVVTGNITVSCIIFSGGGTACGTG